MPHLSILQQVYHIKEISANTYQKANKDWLFMKYHHSLDVLQLGDQLIEAEQSLSLLDHSQKQTLKKSLLWHDIGRAFEKDEQGQTIPNFLHGAEGMHYLKSQLKVDDVALLAAVMVHDRMDLNFLMLDYLELATCPTIRFLSPEAKESVLMLNKAFHALSESEKSFVLKAVHLVKDADTLANIQVFEKLINYSKAPLKAVITPAVFQSINQRSYVDYQDIHSLPDQGLVYFGWMYHFHFEATRLLAKKHSFAEKIKTYVLSTLKENKDTDSASLSLVETQYNKAISLLASVN